jgi:hypothetical protein
MKGPAMKPINFGPAYASALFLFMGLTLANTAAPPLIWAMCLSGSLLNGLYMIVKALEAIGNHLKDTSVIPTQENAAEETD